MLELAPNTMHLWVGAPPVDISVALPNPELVLSVDEQQRWRRFVRPADRDRFAWVHASLRNVLSKYADVEPPAWSFARGEFGRPEISRALATTNPRIADLRFNVSYTEQLLAVVVNQTFDAGVDIEQVGRVSDTGPVVRTSFSSDEAAQLAALTGEERQTRFVELWTLKEALLKARGTGGHVSLAEFSFELHQGRGIRFASETHTEVNPTAWTFALRGLTDRHILALACKPNDVANPPEVVTFELT